MINIDEHFINQLYLSFKYINSVNYIKKNKKDEILYKIDTIIDFLIENDGENYKLYECCPRYIDKPDSNIVEYAKDIKNIFMYDLGINNEELPFI